MLRFLVTLATISFCNALECPKGFVQGGIGGAIRTKCFTYFNDISENWSWIDGAPFNFAFWAKDESSDAAGPRCAYMNADSGTWSTDGCAAKRPFVCMVSLLNQLAPKPCSTCSLACPTLASTEMILCSTNNNTSQSRMPLSPGTASTERPTTVPLPLPAIIVTPTVAFALLFGGLFVAYRYFCASRRTDRSRCAVSSSASDASLAIAPNMRGTFNSALHPIKIDLSDLSISSYVLNAGTVANIYRGYLLVSSSAGASFSEIRDGGRKPVAVKVLHCHLAKAHRSDALSEVELMLRLGMATHIVGLIGYTYLNEVPVLVSEYCGKGDLLTFLRESLADYQDCIRAITDGLQTTPYSNTDLSLIDLVSFAWQISDGMEFLSIHNIVHRQLTASNILLTTRHVAKIGGFGKCRHSDEALWTSCREAEAPLKWMAPEALSEPTFSTENDTWAYGVVLFEIFSAGAVPYEHVKAADLLQFLMDGHRLEQPTLAPIDIYRLMAQCWDASPSRRPSFGRIRRFLSKCLERLAEYGRCAPSTRPERTDQSNGAYNEILF